MFCQLITQLVIRAKSSYSYVLSSLDKQYFTMSIFIDLRKAFDILCKSRFCSDRGVSGDNLKSYLSNRLQLI